METHVRLPERIGFETFGMRNLFRALFPFFHCRCSVPAERLGDEPLVFVCNHYEIFGPLAVAVSLPVRFRLWMSNEMLEPERYVDKTALGLQHAFPMLSLERAKSLYLGLCPLTGKALHKLTPIPVHREDPSRIINTMRQTAEAMARGEHVVIFPEDGQPRYSNGSVTEFMQGFALVGEFYRRETGKDARFCPLYIDKRHRRLCFGDVVTYGRGNAIAESSRVSREIREQMLEMARASGYREEKDPARISAAVSA